MQEKGKQTETETKVKPVSAPKRACNNKETEARREGERERDGGTSASRDIGTDAPISLADRCFRVVEAGH